MLDHDTPTQTAIIEKLNHEGRGITHLDGKITFIDGALPAEHVSFTITKRHSRFNEAKLTNVLTAAAQRVTPGCQHFGVCGGCSLQHLSVEAQIAHKQQVLFEQLQHFGKISPQQILAPLTAKPWGYRRKARLGVRYVHKKQQLLVGFRERDSRYLAIIEQCEVLEPRVGYLIMPLRELITNLEAYQHIAQIEVAIGDTQVGLVFRHLKPLSANDHQQLIIFGKRHQVQIYLQPGNPDSIHSIYPDNPQLSYHLPNHQLELLFRPTDFVQINTAINQQLVDSVLHFMQLEPSDQVLDLFCGLGNFTLPFARYSQYVTGVEVVNSMVEQAQRNALHNKLSNVHFVCSDLTQPFITQPWAKPTYNKLFIDPPRSGALEVIQQLPHIAPSLIVYVSCNPATLARDAGELVHKQGYTLTHAGIIDMFTHTQHVESIAVFKK
ncbi:MAG: 23S rRNA (uracil(1939)-C(5))-methyltransferase RlmD [Gammaproteobacteria bacterium]